MSDLNEKIIASVKKINRYRLIEYNEIKKFVHERADVITHIEIGHKYLTLNNDGLKLARRSFFSAREDYFDNEIEDYKLLCYIFSQLAILNLELAKQAAKNEKIEQKRLNGEAFENFYHFFDYYSSVVEKKESVYLNLVKYIKETETPDKYISVDANLPDQPDKYFLIDKCLKEAYKLTKDRVKYFYLFGDVYCEKKDIEKALEFYQKAINSDKKRFNNLNIKIGNMLRFKDPEKSKEYYEIFVENFNNNFDLKKDHLETINKLSLIESRYYKNNKKSQEWIDLLHKIKNQDS